MDNITPDNQTDSLHTGAVERKSQYHHGNLRSAIIDSVAELIGEKRSLDFQLKEVTSKVGTSQAALYRHFEGKKSLLVETAVVGYDIQKHLRDSYLAKSGTHALEKIIAVGFAYLRFAQNYFGYFMLMKVMETDEILSSDRYCHQRDETLACVRQLISEAMKEGTLKEGDVDIIMTSLQATASGLASFLMGGQLSLIARERYQDTDLFSKVLTIHLSGLLTPKGMKVASVVNAKPYAIL